MLHLVATPILLVYLITLVVLAVKAPSYLSVIAALNGLALLLVAIAAREMAVKAQDRIIRLEMRLRLTEVLPPELKPRIRELTVRQLVSLRFASDHELPELVKRTLAGEFRNGEEIKKAVTDWQTDWLRV